MLLQALIWLIEQRHSGNPWLAKFMREHGFPSVVSFFGRANDQDYLAIQQWLNNQEETPHRDMQVQNLYFAAPYVNSDLKDIKERRVLHWCPPGPFGKSRMEMQAASSTTGVPCRYWVLLDRNIRYCDQQDAEMRLAIKGALLDDVITIAALAQLVLDYVPHWEVGRQAYLILTTPPTYASHGWSVDGFYYDAVAAQRALTVHRTALLNFTKDNGGRYRSEVVKFQIPFIGS